ncbi:Shikimate dehydrogenase [Tepidanaerobacter acetatoxydans Re1]|uniref:Shikimate dehydrogenase (NADP(+)) n=1 Tax=Tepidanaerobacter acetatoxydans (strain DSM 21804 / JCM 16047 / Re1) TaxID=1209989 RepID=F4LXN4_TEPAE|nr:shikimate dehydrogenase [Tepidanaerobacter acetatoxydans]AEE91963.1 Shikimate dehydrogenase [Tepidanaerobacter acetatoxydans Re1]CDI40863.1 Shikimate dehydrogenase [Tepidanaerobacter acetatoxydans Re1]
MNKNHIVSGKTQIYAILGTPISHSLSPIIHNTLFCYNNLDKIFLALNTDTNNLKLAIDAVRSFDIKGLSITMPLKEEVVKYCDKLLPEAEIIGAVNCILNKNGTLVGYNTDCTGFSMSIINKVGVLPDRVFIFGAGGVGKAIAAELILKGVKKLFLTNRSIDKAENLRKRLEHLSKTEVEIIPWDKKSWNEGIKESDLIINCTSLGMYNNGNLADIVPWELVRSNTLIYETIYEPRETTLISKARSLNLEVIEGINLLVYQAAAAYKIWTGLEPDINIIFKVAKASVYDN